MEKPTTVLSNEHKNIITVIDAVLAECVLVENGSAVDADFFTKAVAFIREYADAFHHAKEEDILFVELGKDGIPMPPGPVQQMLTEHDQGRNHVKGMIMGLENNDKDRLCSSARGYCELLKQHIFKEDHILYPMADQVLDDAIQEAMQQAFIQVEQEKKEALHVAEHLAFAAVAATRHNA